MLIVPRATVAQQLGVKPRTVDAWARRGHITRHDGGYDVTEVLAWWDSPDRRRMADTRGKSAGLQSKSHPCNLASSLTSRPQNQAGSVPSDPIALMKGETAHLKSCAYPGCRGGMMSHVGPVCWEHALLIAEAVNWSQDQVITNAQAAAALRRQRSKEQAQALAESRGTQPGWIYYIRVGDRIKIGYSTDVKKRMRAYPPGSQLLAVHPGTLKLETEMHQRFAGSRAAGREWFRETIEVAEHIAQVLEQFGEPTGHRYNFRTDRTPLRSRPA